MVKETPTDEGLKIQGIRKSFKATGGQSVLILDDVTFSIPKNKFVVLFGPNGSGKSTLLSIIAGVMYPDAGSLTLARPGGESFRSDLVFQNYRDSLYPWLNALDNIAFPLTLQGVPKKRRREEAAALLERIGADILRKSEYLKYPYQLSGGQQQLVSIARSLVTNPDLLLLDESFAALDHDTRYLMQDVVVDIWERMKFYVLFISHSIWEAVYMGDILVILSKKPAHVLDIIDIPLPRPRKREVEFSQDFFDLRSRALKVFEEELYGSP